MSAAACSEPATALPTAHRFQPWPESSLFSVAKKFLDEVDLGEEFLRNAVVEFMPYSFALVNKVSKSE